MEIQEAIKTTYENVGFAVIDIKPIDGTPIFEMEFVTPQGFFKKHVVTFFALAELPGDKQPCQHPL